MLASSPQPMKAEHRHTKSENYYVQRFCLHAPRVARYQSWTLHKAQVVCGRCLKSLLCPQFLTGRRLLIYTHASKACEHTGTNTYLFVFFSVCGNKFAHAYTYTDTYAHTHIINKLRNHASKFIYIYIYTCVCIICTNKHPTQYIILYSHGVFYIVRCTSIPSTQFNCDQY